MTRAGAADAVAAERDGIGPVLPDADPRAAAAALNRITPSDLDRWRGDQSRLPRRLHVTTDEETARRSESLRAAGAEASAEAHEPRR